MTVDAGRHQDDLLLVFDADGGEKLGNDGNYPSTPDSPGPTSTHLTLGYLGGWVGILTAYTHTDSTS